MKSKAEKCFSLPLKYDQVQDFQLTVSCSFMAVEPAFQHDGMPRGVPCGELPEGLMRGDHGGADAPARSLGEEDREDVSEEELPRDQRSSSRGPSTASRGSTSFTSTWISPQT